jgi:putative flippase GtrA
MSIVVYFFVGGASFLANFVIFLMFVHLMGLHWVLGNIAGFIAGTFINYVLSVRFVFKSKNFLRRDFEVYLTFMVSALGVGLETILIHLEHDVASLNLNVSKLGAAGVVFFWNYGARRFLIFGAVKRLGWGPMVPTEASDKGAIDI